MTRIKWKFFFIIPLIVVLLTAGLDYLGLFKPLQDRIYQFLITLQGEVPVSDRILLVTVDDEFKHSLDMEEPPRDLLAEGIVLLGEFGAEHLICTGDFSRKSSPGVNPDYLLENRHLLAGRSGPKGENGPGRGELQAEGLIRDKDIYLGEAFVFFGPVYTEVFPSEVPDPTASEDLLRWIGEEHTFSKEIGRTEVFGRTEHLVPPVTPIAVTSAGFGIPGFNPPQPSVRLLTGYRNGYLPQITYLALFYWLGRPEIMLFEDRLVMLQADLPGKEVKDLLIPLGPDGNLLLYRAPDYRSSPFRQISFRRLILHYRLEQDLVDMLMRMERLGLFRYSSTAAGGEPVTEAGAQETNPLDLYEKASVLKKMRMRGGPGSRAEYAELRKQFFTAAGAFFTGDEELLEQRSAEVKELFSEGRAAYESLLDLRRELIGAVEGNLCIYGQTGTAVDMHATLANAVLQEAFYDEVSWWYPLAASALLAFLLSLLMSRTKPFLGAVLGIVITACLTAGLGGSFLITGTFVPAASAGAVLFFTYLICVTVSIVAGGYRKRWVRHSFGRVFPAEVVPQVAALSGGAAMGGAGTAATGVCFNYRQIHTAASGLEPKEAVSLTAEVTANLRECVLSARGSAGLSNNESCTAVFGAPVQDKESVTSACTAALFMEQKDMEINRQLESRGVQNPDYRTEIGIHTGDLVIGDIGEELYINYTVSGLGAILLAKLASSNREYGTRIVATENTKKRTENSFVFRRLDRVRAEENSLPVQIYELVGRKETLSAETAELLRIFEEGLLLFEKRNWAAAHKRFIEGLKTVQRDGPSELFARRCQKYVKTPPAASWDGVFNLPN